MSEFEDFDVPDNDEPQIGAPATSVVGNNVELRNSDPSVGLSLRAQQAAVALTNQGASVTVPSASFATSAFQPSAAPEQPHRAASVSPQPHLAAVMTRKASISA